MHEMKIRVARPGDEAVARLAALDSAPAPTDHALVAEVGGRAVAAVAQGGGAVVADPFERTEEAVGVLVRRAAQLRGEGVAGSLRSWRRGERSRPRPVARPVRPAAPRPSIQGAALAR